MRTHLIYGCAVVIGAIILWFVALVICYVTSAIPMSRQDELSDYIMHKDDSAYWERKKQFESKLLKMIGLTFVFGGIAVILLAMLLIYLAEG